MSSEARIVLEECIAEMQRLIGILLVASERLSENWKNGADKAILRADLDLIINTNEEILATNDGMMGQMFVLLPPHQAEWLRLRHEARKRGEIRTPKQREKR